MKDHFTSRDIVARTQIADPKAAYHAVTSNPQFAALLQEVPAKHPAQLYESICYVFVFAILFFMYWRTNARERQGFLFGLFLVLLWSVRFAVEFVKESQGGIEEYLGLFSTGQWLSIPFILVGLYFIFNAEKPIEEL